MWYNTFHEDNTGNNTGPSAGSRTAPAEGRKQRSLRYRNNGTVSPQLAPLPDRRRQLPGQAMDTAAVVYGETLGGGCAAAAVFRLPAGRKRFCADSLQRRHL